MLFVPSASFAQTVYGSIFGTVTDNTGASIPGATVTVTDEAKGTVVVVQSGASGDYSVEHLVPDLYDVKVTFQGFETFETKGIQVYADSSPKVDVKMVVGGEATTVEVNADTVPVLKSDRADVSTEISQQEVANLPVAGRNFTNLQLLLPGAQTLSWAHASDENPQGSAQIQVDGQAFGGVGFELDGTDNQDAILGIIVINPTLDSVSEVKIATQNFDAEFGKAVSSIVTSQTKSGTNSFHGSLFDYRTSNANLAKNPYTQYPAFGTNPRVPVSPGLKSLFGGSVGGPILKDKLFFFGDYQGQRQVAGVSATTTIPTSTLRNTCLGLQAVNAASQAAGAPAAGCDFSDYTNAGGTGNGIAYQPNGTPYPGNVIPLTQVAPQWLNVLKLLPAPTISPAGNGSLTGIGSNYTASGSGPFNNNAWNERVDYTLSEKIHVFERFSRFTDSLVGGQIFGALGGPGVGYNNYGGNSKGANDSVAVGADYAISASLLTDLRFGYYRYDIIDTKVDQAATPATTLLGIPGLNTSDPSTGGLPDFNISAPGSAGNNFGDGLNVSRCNCPLTEKEDQFQIVNNWTKIIKTHSVKIGMDLRYARNLRVPSDANRTGILNINDGPTSNPNLSNAGGNGWATFALGQVPSFNRYVSSSTNAKEFQKRDFFYVQDTWRATPNLTLNLGVRYEVYFPESVNGKGNGALMQYNHGSTNGYLNVAGYGSVPSDMGWSPSKFPFNPRIGVAYQFDPKTVIRAGYGRSFDIGVFGSLFGHVVTQNLPVLANQSISSSSSTGYEFCLGPTTAAGGTGVNPNCTPAPGQPATGGPAPNVFPAVPSNGLLPAPGFNVGIKARPNDVRLPTIDAWNLSVQRAITPTLSITMAYVGNKGTHTLSAGDGNSTGPDEAAVVLPAQYSVTGTPLHWDPNGGNCYPAGPNCVPGGIPGKTSTTTLIPASGATNAGTFLTRYYGGVLPACQQASYIAAAAAAGVTLPANGGCGYANNNIGYYGNDQDSHFNALQITVAKQYTKGLSGNVAYAWQKGIDFSSQYATWDKRNGEGRNNDIREQQITIYGVYDLPFGKKGMFATNVPTWADEIIGGWQLSPVLNWGSGLPFSLGYNECNNATGGSNAICFPNGRAGFLKTHLTGLDPVAHQRTFFNPVVPAGHSLCDGGTYQGFTCPGLDQLGNTGRNSNFGPTFFNTDMSVVKRFPIHESINFQFRMDAFNLFNIVSAGNPSNTNIEAAGYVTSNSGSNQFPGYAPGAQPRQLSFSLRVEF
jgi:outer membrane receptor protein involved in Fe transport